MAKHPEVRRYLDAYVDTPLADRLGRAWVRRLAKDEAWPEILEVYRPLNDVTMRCLYVRALYEKGSKQTEKFSSLVTCESTLRL